MDRLSSGLKAVYLSRWWWYTLCYATPLSVVSLCRISFSHFSSFQGLKFVSSAEKSVSYVSDNVQWLYIHRGIDPTRAAVPYIFVQWHFQTWDVTLWQCLFITIMDFWSHSFPSCVCSLHTFNTLRNLIISPRLVPEIANICPSGCTNYWSVLYEVFPSTGI